MKVVSIVCARPNFIKSAPLLNELQRHSKIETMLVHSIWMVRKGTIKFARSVERKPRMDSFDGCAKRYC